MGDSTIRFNEDVDIDRKELIEVFRDSQDDFSSLSRMATQVCDTPVSLLNFLDENFQYTISQSGEWSFDRVALKENTDCQFTVMEDDLLVINDTLEDERTADIKVLTEEQEVRFYAGMPIRSAGGAPLGALCVIDYEPKDLLDDQKQALKDLAGEVEYRLKLYRQRKKLELNNRRLEEAAAFLSNSTDILWVINPEDFRIKRSKGAEPVFEVSDLKISGRSLFDLIRDIDIQRHLKQWISGGEEEGRLGVPLQIEMESGLRKWITLTFTKHKGDLLATGRDITKQHEMGEKLKDSLREKEVLLAEVHHRVKNNLAVICSLLQLERMKIDNKKIGRILMNSESRIITIGKIHELLYKTNNFAHVDLREYVSDLVDSLKGAFNFAQEGISVKLNIMELSVNVNQALPVGLIINELVVNAIKHAFPSGRAGTITISAMEVADGKVRFEVGDDGKGMGISLSPADLEEEGNMGFTLINTLKKQLGADLEIQSEDGTSFIFTFRKNNHKGSVSALGKDGR